MELKEFLSMIAFENSISSIEQPHVYGYKSWAEMYDVVSNVQETSFDTPTGITIYLIEEESWVGNLHDVLTREYNNSAWVIKRAQDVGGVVYEKA